LILKEENDKLTGIYCIKVDKAIVYIGKSRNIQSRLHSHFIGICQAKENKYSLLKTAYFKHIPITFFLLEECSEIELDEKE
jgi:excinuclease UvrABC nuclease subunit